MAEYIYIYIYTYVYGHTHRSSSKKAIDVSKYPGPNALLDPGVYMYVCWRASEASETLSGVTQLKIGDACLFICLDVLMSFCTLTLSYFRVSSTFYPVPNITKQYPPV